MFEFNELSLPNLVTIYEACDEALESQKMIGILGYPGSGKSYSLKAYVQSRTNVFRVELGASVTPKEMYVRILRAVQGTDKKITGTAADILRRIRIALDEIGGNKLIVIDEAGKFKKDRVGYFHELRNLTEYRCGIVISGPDYFQDHILKWIEAEIPGVEEFYSRVSYWLQLGRPEDMEIKAMFKSEGFGSRADERALLKEILKWPKEKRTYRDIRHAIDEMLSERKRREQEGSDEFDEEDEE